jgi:hypothetical protein
MLPKLMTLSRFFADSANVAPCGRTYPRFRDSADPVDDREPDDRPEKVETVEAVEKHRSSDGQAERAAVGESEGDGEDPLVSGGEGEGERSRANAAGAIDMVATAAESLRQVRGVRKTGGSAMARH